MADCISDDQPERAFSRSDIAMEYREAHRPQYHFSPRANWMNDPNGMVYFEGEYHLFYQYYPDSTVWGPMHWGHAVSEDLVHWQHLPIALYPDSHGYIFSGSAVVDWENTSGLGSKGHPPLVAIYTYHNPEKAEDPERTDIQSQGIAYSLDKGRSWMPYEGNPVLNSPGIRDFRDPKVIWYEPGQKWIMTLAVKDRVSFYSSKDLREWVHESDFGMQVGSHGGVWECPDLFPLSVEGTDETLWVLLLSINPGGPAGGSATQYFIGQFDGSAFVLDTSFAPDVEPVDGEEQAVWLDYGADNYAGVTWSDVPEEDNRRLFIGWMSNWNYAQVVPTVLWRSAMTIPRELILLKRAGSYRIASRPVKELESLVSASVDVIGSIQEGVTIDDSLFIIELSAEDLEGAVLLLENMGGEKVSIQVSNGELIFDRTASGIVDFHQSFAGRHRAPLEGDVAAHLQVYVDLSSIEVFVNHGSVVMTELVFPSSPYRKIVASGELTSAKVRTMKGIWQETVELERAE